MTQERTDWAQFWKEKEKRHLPTCSECGNLTLFPTTGIYTRDNRCIYGPGAPGICNACVMEKHE